MDVTEAQICLLAIRGSLESARQYTLDLDRRRGWKALGYTSLANCFEAELGISIQHGYRLLAAYEVEEAIATQLPDEAVLIKERWVRDLKLDELQPEQLGEMYTSARQLQTSERAVKLTKEHVRVAVAQIRARNEVFQSPYPIVTQMVLAGKMTAEAGQQFLIAVDKLRPQQRGAVLELMGKFGFQNADLVGPVGTMFGRSADKESLMLPEVLTGYLGGVPLAQATMTNWQQAVREAQAQHIADKLNDGSVQAVIMTVYKGSPARTVEALKEVLGEEIWNIRDLLMRE